MSKIVRVSESNYRLQVQSGGTITLDTGTDLGWVEVTGNLRVKGTTTTIDTANMTIEDNIILLNKGETGAGVTEGTSGLEVARGTLPNARLIFNESVQWYDPVNAEYVQGAWTFVDSTGKTGGIRVASVANDGNADLVFDLQNSDKVLLIGNSVNYEARLSDPNHVPNLQWVYDYVDATGGMAVVDKIYKNDVYGQKKALVQTYNNAGNGQVRMYINQVSHQTFQVDTFGLTMYDSASGDPKVNINQSTITNQSNVDNLILTASTGIVEVEAFAQLNDRSVITTPDPLAVSFVADATVMFSSPVAGAGKTGIYFVHKRSGEPGQTINETVNDELIAKNRALLFSMVF